MARPDHLGVSRVPSVAPLETYHTVLPPISVALQTFGSTALCDFLHRHPDVFEFSHHGNRGLSDNIRIFYYNINGLDGFEHEELIAFLSSANVDCLVLIDARIFKRVTATTFFAKPARYSARVQFVLCPLRQRLRTLQTVITASWLGDLHTQSDPSGLFMADKVVLKSCHGRLQIIATNGPFPAPSGLPR